MRILVTGGMGFIGSNLCGKLANFGHEVRILDLRKRDGSLCPYDYRMGDILDRNGLTIAMRGVDLVVHLAAKHRFFGIAEKEFFLVNETGTKNILEEMTSQGIQKIIFYSTVAVYGESNGPTDEQTALRPNNAYGISKLRAERLARKWAEEDKNRRLIILRPTVVFGPQNRGNIFRLIRQIYHRAYIPVGEGENVKSIAYVENLVDATLFLLKQDMTGIEVFNYSDSPHMKYREIVEIIYSALGRRAPQYYLPLAPVQKISKFMDKILNVSGINLSVETAIRKMNKATEHQSKKILEMGFLPKYSSMEGLKKMVEWFVEEQKPKNGIKTDG